MTLLEVNSHLVIIYKVVCEYSKCITFVFKYNIYYTWQHIQYTALQYKNSHKACNSLQNCIDNHIDSFKLCFTLMYCVKKKK